MVSKKEKGSKFTREDQCLSTGMYLKVFVREGGGNRGYMYPAVFVSGRDAPNGCCNL